MKKGAEDYSPAPYRFQPRSRSTLPGAPPFVVALASAASIRHRRDFHPNFHLFVTLHWRLFRSTALLTPDQGELVPTVDVGIDHAQGQPASLVVAVTAEHGISDRLASLLDSVVGRRCVVGNRQVKKLVVVGSGHEQGGVNPGQVLAIPRKSHFLTVRLAGYLLQGLAADEIVIELHERAVTQLVGSQVIVLDVIR